MNQVIEQALAKQIEAQCHWLEAEPTPEIAAPIAAMVMRIRAMRGMPELETGDLKQDKYTGWRAKRLAEKAELHRVLTIDRTAEEMSQRLAEMMRG